MQSIREQGTGENQQERTQDWILRPRRAKNNDDFPPKLSDQLNLPGEALFVNMKRDKPEMFELDPWSCEELS